jgi:YmgG-like glycine-zipper protein
MRRERVATKQLVLHHWREEKMNRARRIVLAALVVALAGMSLTVQGQGPSNVRRTNVRNVLSRIETRSGIFRRDLSDALRRIRNRNINPEEINQLVSDFQNSTAILRANVNSRRESTRDVEDVLNRAQAIDNIMVRTPFDAQVDRDWSRVRTDLTELARLYNVSWNWSSQTAPIYGQNQGTPYNRLTGTYRLDTTRSEDPRSAAERATRNLPARDRQRVLDALTARLESPESLAIDRRGRNVTIASTRAPQISFVADGSVRTEQLPNGRTVRVSASLSGDQLNISQSGDRGNDFSVTFEPLDNGRRLRITRRISADRLTQPVVVESIYDKTADVAQLDLYNSYPNSTTTGTGSGGFIVPSGTSLVAELNESLTTKESRENDRFTMTVRSPGEYEGAVIEGHITGVKSSGRITGRSEMTMNFDRIRLRDGRTFDFAGFVESIRTANGETVRVDNEGVVQDSDSRTSTTAKRAAIGTAVGAIIGAIAGGGKGAAIGAVIGAGAGAGSVYVQGKDDLELPSGTEVTIRASAPR